LSSVIQSIVFLLLPQSYLLVICYPYKTLVKSFTISIQEIFKSHDGIIDNFILKILTIKFIKKDNTNIEIDKTHENEKDDTIAETEPSLQQLESKQLLQISFKQSKILPKLYDGYYFFKVFAIQ